MTKSIIIKGLEIPGELIDAYDDDSLVLFVGAGPSTATGYPCFEALVSQISRECNCTAVVKEPYELFLERLNHKSKRDIHEVAHTLLCNWELKNLTYTLPHRTLLTFFGDPAKVKIITTNYDMLFEAAAALNGWRLPVRSYGHRLTVAGDFHGIAYLHGCLTDGPRALVLTESDFGVAYDLRRRPKTFLGMIFEHFTVSFIGYNLGDARVRYLLQSIRRKQGDRKHFHFWGSSPMQACSSAEMTSGVSLDEGDWAHLGLDKIAYDSANRHAVLYECLSELARMREAANRDGKRLGGVA